MNASDRAFTLAIIAGGKSRRMGSDKAFLRLGGKTLIQRVIDAGARLNPAETIIIANDADAFARFNLPVYPDVLPDKGSLGGIYSALYHAKTEFTLNLACDMPFVNPRLLRYMASLIDDEIDIIAPRVNGYPQALHAFYRRTCMTPIRRQIDANRLKIIRFYDSMRVRYIDEAEYAPFDRDGLSFENLNTPDELARARRYLEAQPAEASS